MVVRFIGLLSLLIVSVASQSYQQYGNYLNNQGAGGYYPNQVQPFTQSYQQNGMGYQSPSVQSSTPHSAVAHGVAQYQRIKAQPLPQAYRISTPSTELAPLATASATFAPSQPQNVQQQQTGQFFYPPSPNNFYQPQQQNTINTDGNYYNQYQPNYYPYQQNNNSTAYREPPVINFTFKEGKIYLKSGFGRT